MDVNAMRGTTSSDSIADPIMVIPTRKALPTIIPSRKPPNHQQRQGAHGVQEPKAMIVALGKAPS